MSISEEDGSPRVSLEYPLVKRSELNPARSTQGFLSFRRPRELSLSNVVLASGIALAVEGLRLAVRTNRKRAAVKREPAASTQITLTYEWTQVTYERYERP
jgi:hypothetical protein